MFLVDRPNITYIYEEIAGAEVGELQRRITSGHREIRMFGPENIIFVDDSRYPGAPGRGGPVGRVARVTPNRSFCVRVLKLFGTAVRHPLAPSGASTEVPRRISLGFAHSAAAGGDLCRRARTQHAPVGKPFAIHKRTPVDARGPGRVVKYCSWK